MSGYVLLFLFAGVFTSAVLELHLLFIRVLLGFYISTVPERECRTVLWSCIQQKPICTDFSQTRCQCNIIASTEDHIHSHMCNYTCVYVNSRKTPSYSTLCTASSCVYEQVDVSFCLYTPFSLNKRSLEEKTIYFSLSVSTVAPFHTPFKALTPEVE